MIEKTAREHARTHRRATHAALALVLASAGCLAVEPTDGVLVCAAESNACPPGYSCAADLHCWHSLSGSEPSPDLALDTVTPPDDLSVPGGGDVPDLTGATPGPMPDLATTSPPPDLATKPLDMTTPPDMTPVFNYCPAGTLFCDNFENDTIATNAAGNWSGTFVQPAGGTQTLTTGTTQKHDGTKALHAATSMTVDSWSTLIYSLAQPAAAVTLRWFVFPAASLANLGEVARVFNATTGDGFQVGATPGGDKWFISENLGGVDHSSTTTIVNNAWTCLELVVPATGNVQLYVNGSATAAISFTPLKSELYNSVHAGVEWAPANVPVDVWIDQVAVSTGGRLPCPTN